MLLLPLQADYIEGLRMSLLAMAVAKRNAEQEKGKKGKDN